MNFVAIDFETANPNADSACAIGLVKVENFQVVEQVEYLIRPPSKWFEFTYIHDIDWSMVADKPTFGELHPQIDRFLAGTDFLAAHNASFDRKVLAACRETYQIEPTSHRFLCTVQLARQQWQIRPTKLSDVCRQLDIKLQHHHALSDAHACAQIIIAAGAKATFKLR
jgi:DNA polymerase III subunit epsilon